MFIARRAELQIELIRMQARSSSRAAHIRAAPFTWASKVGPRASTRAGKFWPDQNGRPRGANGWPAGRLAGWRPGPRARRRSRLQPNDT